MLYGVQVTDKLYHIMLYGVQVTDKLYNIMLYGVQVTDKLLHLTLSLMCEFESRSGRGVQQYVIKFVSDLRQVGGFLRVFRFPPPIKLTATI
jgi:hypothetical protein